jgi:hypothetical protein
VTEGFFFAQQTPRGAVREKSGRHQPLQCRRAQPVEDQSGRRTRRRLGERYGTTLSGGGADERFKAIPWTNEKARRVSPSNAPQQGPTGSELRAVARCHAVEAAKARVRRDERRLGDCCGRSSTPAAESSVQARSVVRSPRYQRPSHGRDVPPRDGTVAAAVEAVGDASGKNEKLIRTEYAILSP